MILAPSDAQDLLNLIETERQLLNIDPNDPGFRDLIEFCTQFAIQNSKNAYEAMNRIVILPNPNSPFHNKSLLHFFTHTAAGRKILFHCKEIQSLIDPKIMQGKEDKQPAETGLFKGDSANRARDMEALLDNERLFATLSPKSQDLVRIAYSLTHKDEIRDSTLKSLINVYKIDQIKDSVAEKDKQRKYFYNAFVNICTQIANHRLYSSYSFTQLINLQFTVDKISGFTLLHCFFNENPTRNYFTTDTIQAIKFETFNCRLSDGEYKDSSPLSILLSWRNGCQFYANSLHLLEITGNTNLNLPIAACPYRGISIGHMFTKYTDEAFVQAFKNAPKLEFKLSVILWLEHVIGKENFSTINPDFKQFSHQHNININTPITTIEEFKNACFMLLQNYIADDFNPQTRWDLVSIFKEMKLLIENGASLADFLNHKSLMGNQIISTACLIMDDCLISQLISRIPNLSNMLDKETINGYANRNVDGARISVASVLSLKYPCLLDDVMIEKLEDATFNETGTILYQNEKIENSYGVLINLASTRAGRNRIIASKVLVDKIDIQAFCYKKHPTDDSAFDYFINSDEYIDLFVNHPSFTNRLPGKYKNIIKNKLNMQLQKTQQILDKYEVYQQEGEFFKNVDELIELAEALKHDANLRAKYWANMLITLCIYIKSDLSTQNLSLTELLNRNFSLGNEQNHGLLLCLLALPISRIILLNSDVMKSLSPDIFNKRLTSGVYQGLSPFTVMFDDDDGLDIIDTTPYALLDLVTSDNLNTPIEAAPFSGQTPAERLAESTSGYQVLVKAEKLALQLNAFNWIMLKFASKTNVKTLEFLRPSSLEGYTDSKISSALELKINCSTLLKSVIAANSSVEELIIYRLITLMFQIVPDDEEDTDPEILANLLNHNLAGAAIPREERNNSLGFLLAYLPLTAGLLSKITDIGTLIKEKTLNTPHPSGSLIDKSMLTSLCMNNPEIFAEKELVKKIDRKRFNNVFVMEYPDNSRQNEYYGPLYKLATTARGRKALINNAYLVSLINNEFFIQGMSSRFTGEKNLYEYFLEDENVESGLALFIQYPDFAKSLPQLIRKKIHDQLKMRGLVEIPGLYYPANTTPSTPAKKNKKGDKRKKSVREYGVPTPADSPSLSQRSNQPSIKPRIDSSMINEALKFLPALFNGLTIAPPTVDKETQQIIFTLPLFNVDWEYKFNNDTTTLCRLDKRKLQVNILNSITKDNDCETEIEETEHNVIVKITVNRVASLRDESIFANIPSRLKRKCLAPIPEVTPTSNNIAPDTAPTLDDDNVNILSLANNHHEPLAEEPVINNQVAIPAEGPVLDNLTDRQEEVIVKNIPTPIVAPLPVERRPINKAIFLDEQNTCFLNNIVSGLETMKDKLNSTDRNVTSETINNKLNNIDCNDENYEIFFSWFITTLEHFEVSIDIRYDQFNEAYHRLTLEQFCECATPIIEHLAQKLKNIFIRNPLQLFAPVTPKSLFLSNSDVEHIGNLIIEACEKTNTFSNRQVPI